MHDQERVREPSGEWKNMVPRDSGGLRLDKDFDIWLLRDCPLVMQSVQKVASDAEVPVGMALMAVLGAISLVSQRLIDVRRPRGIVGPVSLYVLLVADSGARKTTVEGLVYEAVRDFQRSVRERYGNDLMAWNVAFDLWAEKFKKLKKSIAKLDAGSPEYLAGEAELQSLMMSQPKKPANYKVLLEDATSEALFAAMYDGASNAGLISSEGVGILNGRAFNDYAKLNSLWNGSDIVVDRVKEGERMLSGARLTTSIMVQEGVLFEYIERKGNESRGVGLWARALICRPISLHGQRLINGVGGEWGCEGFSARINELLGLSQSRCGERDVISFSDQAKSEWNEMYNFIETEMRPGGGYQGAVDHASKLAENIARVAALLAYFERGASQIELSDLEASAAICFWCSRFFIHYFVGLSPDEQNAEILEWWLEQNYHGVFSDAKKNDIRRAGPGRLRDIKVLNRAIAVLEGRGRLKSFTRYRTNYVRLVTGS